MTTPSTCPGKKSLQALLDDALSPEAQGEVIGHLDHCTGCQCELEKMAAGDPELVACVRSLNQGAAPEKTSAYWPAIDALERATLAVATPSPDADLTPPPADARLDSGLSLNFLLKSETPGHLGRLANFEIIRVIGRGGMGVVMHGFDNCLQRDVAIKVLDPNLAQDEIAVKRFCREARAAAALTHENVVAVHQVEHEEEADLPFLVMQLVHGEALDERLRREGQLTLNEIVRIGMQTARGLAAAHAKGLIHRDVKPANILLERGTNTVKLTDFGLARAAEDVRLTSSGIVAGTPLYMAPEQARGEEIDHRADLFSLGVVLYELAAGETPFWGKTPLMVLKRLTEEEHRPIRELNPNLPVWLTNIIDKLLAKKPADRFQSAAEVADLLEQHWALLRSSQDIKCPKAVPPAARPGVGRHAMIGLGLAAVVLGLAMSFVGYYIRDRMAHNPAVTPPAETPPLAVFRANSGTVWSIVFSPDGQTMAMGLEDGTVRLWDVAEKRVRATLTAHRGTVWHAAYSPDGKVLATSGDDGLVKLWEADGSKEIRALTHPNAVRGFAFDPRGKRLIAGDRQGGLTVWDLEHPDPILHKSQFGAIYAVAFAPDGKTFAFAGSDKIVRVWDANALQERFALAGHTGPIYGLAFSPDGKQLASGGWDKVVRMWDLASGSQLQALEGNAYDVWSVAFDPKGRWVAGGGQDGTLRIWDAKSGKLLATLRGNETTVHIIAFDHSGNFAASGGRDGSVRLWDVGAILK